MKSAVSKFFIVLAVLVGGVFVLAWTGPDNVALSNSPEMQGVMEAHAELGKAVYDAKCAVCHGVDGKGNGPVAITLNPPPRDFTAGKYKFRSTESGSIPTDDDLLKSIRDGLHGTSMSDWKPFLNGDSLRAVLSYVKSFSPRFKNEKPKAVAVGLMVPISNATLTEGKRVYARLQCGKCHGKDGNGAGAVTTEFKDDWGNDIATTKLTEPWTFRGGSSVRDIYLRFRTGIDGTPMPSYAGTASNRELWSVAQYVASLARKPVWTMNEQELKMFYERKDEEAKSNPVQRGKYLVKAIGCEGCHSMFTKDGSFVDGMLLAGGLTFDLYPFGKYTARNLTSDKETGLGDWTDDEILKLFNEGINKQGRKLLPFPMPWVGLAQLKEEDKRAIIAYLRTLPPVKNKIPDPEKPGFFAYLWGKFRMLILKEKFPAPLYPVNSPPGMAVGQRVPASSSQAMAVSAHRSKGVRP